MCHTHASAHLLSIHMSLPVIAWAARVLMSLPVNASTVWGYRRLQVKTEGSFQNPHFKTRRLRHAGLHSYIAGSYV